MSQRPPPPPRRIRHRALAVCAGMLVLFGGLSYSAALQKSATFDEPFHALAGWIKLHLHEYQMDYESLPLATMWAQVLNPRSALRFDEASEDWTKLADNPYRGFNLATNTLYRTRGNDGAAFINRGRFMMMLLGVGLCALVMMWSWRIAGPLAGVVAGVLVGLDPNLIGHASLVKTDVAVSLAMAGTIFMIWTVGQRVTPRNAVLLGLVMGVAMNTKFSSVLLWPLMVVLLGVRTIDGSDWMVLNRVVSRVREKGLVAIALLVGAGAMTVGVTWAAHGFRFEPSPNPAVRIPTASYRYERILDRYRQEHVGAQTAQEPQDLDRSIETTQELLDDAAISVDARARLQALIDRAREARPRTPPPDAADRSLQAAEYQLGFVRYFLAQPPDAVDPVVKVGEFLLRNRLMPAAWTHGLIVQYARANILDSYLLGRVRSSGTWYFFPLAILVKTPLSEVIALLGGAGCGIGLIRSRWGSRRRWGWTALCVLLGAVAFMTIAVAGSLNIGLRHVFPVYPFMFVAAAVGIAEVLKQSAPWIHRLAVALGAILLIETLVAWPNYIAHFNCIARAGPGELYLLGDSNLDWGQDLPALKRWQDQHPGVPLALGYFGMAAPEFYGIRAEPLPAWPPPPELRRTHVLAVSATHLQGILDQRYPGYRSLGMPTQVLGGTIYLYDLRNQGN